MRKTLGLTEIAGLLHQKLQKSGFFLNIHGSLPLETKYQLLPIYVHKIARYNMFIILYKNKIITAEDAGLLLSGPLKIGFA